MRMMWIVAATVGAGCGYHLKEGPGLGDGDWLTIGLIVTAISIAASWGFLARRRPTSPLVASRPTRVRIGTDTNASGERLRAPDGTIAVVPFESVVFALRDGFRRIPVVDMRAPDGRHVLIDEDQVPLARSQGYWLMTSSEIKAQ